jgi:AGCS family alanine or glycine:cation symporter
MGGIYVVGALLVIILEWQSIPSMLLMIVTDAFTGTAATGGFAGVAVSQVIIQGVRRAAFSNEAGLGTAPIAHAAAATDEPVREGVVALLEPFIDTVVICTMTALVILFSSAWTADATGVELTALAFNHKLPGFGTWFVPIAVALFAISTLISWSYYGEQAVTYLTRTRSEKAILAYKLVYCVLAVVGAVWAIMPVLNFADIMLGLMAVPNLIAVWMLSGELRADTKNYFERLYAGGFAADATAAEQHRNERKTDVVQ